MSLDCKRYLDYSTYLAGIFPHKMQKISVNGGFSCPNRDGYISLGGCTYCNNRTFHPDYCQSTKSITEQIEEGIAFFSRKYKSMRYLAYFQSYTNTYGETQCLIEKYEEALSHPLVDGLILGTRPDCMADDLLAYLSELSRQKYVMVEYGVESTDDDSLRLVNRGHAFSDAQVAIRWTASAGVHTCAHLILGLPKESRETMLEHARRIAKLPLDTIKLHQLQLIKGTVMARQYEEHPDWFHLFTADEYIDLVIDFLELLPRTIVVERFVSQSPKDLLIAPDWGLKNFEFTAKLEKRLSERNTFQGRRFISSTC
ncbi:MAG: TIGR01212 family radical SAM protein [Paludibacteraceae bacterium]|nr:TIGR01212 family radical SAM protein [Paludibacteraceae bacterium]